MVTKQITNNIKIIMKQELLFIKLSKLFAIDADPLCTRYIYEIQNLDSVYDLPIRFGDIR